MSIATWHLALTVVDRRTGASQDVSVEVPAGSTVGDLAGVLGTSTIDFDGRQVDAGSTLNEVGLCSGVVVGTHGGSGASREGPEHWLRCIGGVQAGRRWPLRDHLSVGRSRTCDIRVPSEEVSSIHATVAVSGGEITVVDEQSTNGTVIDGESIAPGVVHSLDADSTIQIGPALFEVGGVDPVQDAQVHRQADGSLLVRRSPRLIEPPRAPDLTAPSAPGERPVSAIPWPSFLVPMVLGVVAAVLFQRVEMLLFLAIGPLGGGLQTWWNRRQEARQRRQDLVRYQAELADHEQRRAEWAREAGAADREQRPDPVLVLDVVRTPGTRLWERRPTDEDFLHLRVGTSSRFVDDEHVRWTAASPEVVDLPAAGVLGVAGTVTRRLALTRWLLGQVVALHASADVRVAVVGPERQAGTWAAVRWLPHAGFDPDAVRVAMGFHPAGRHDLVSALVGEIDVRREAPGRRLPAMVVVMDHADELRDEPGIMRILSDGPAVGVHTIGLGDTPEAVPEESRVVVRCGRDRGEDRVLDGRPRDQARPLLLDEVSPAWLDRLARSLAALRLGDTADGLPRTTRLLDDLGPMDDPDVVRAAWAEAGVPSTRVLLGRTARGPFHVDLRGDGPHALVVGTTGAGKTGLLQALVVSLASQNRPDQLNVVLMDWKGGGDFAEVGRLPHCRATVTNLDPSRAERALRGLRAEIERRQAVLADMAARGVIHEANLIALWTQAPEVAREVGLPVLVVVVDEFNEFLDAVPELAGGLVSIAAQGRSLGVHLVLAMQRANAGHLSKVLPNVALRIVLRTLERAESRELIDSDDAYEISRGAVGRGFVRWGEPARLVEFQTGYLGGRPPDAASPRALSVRPWPREPGVAADDGATTDLAEVCRAIVKVSAGIVLPPSPLQPPLPDQLPLAELESATGATWGRIDRPDAPEPEDRQPALVVSERVPTNIGIVGSRGFGRTTALATLALAVALDADPDDLHVHAIDISNSGLRDLDYLPHAGTIAVRDVDRIHRLVAYLTSELDRRLARPVDPAPTQWLLVDTWDAVVAQFEVHSDLVQSLLTLARDGPRAGIRLAIAGENRLLSRPLASQLGQRVVLGLTDPGLYSMAGLKPPATEPVPGRGRLVDEPTAQVQLAIPVDGLEAAARACAERWADSRRVSPPNRLRSLPAEVHHDDLQADPDDGPLHLRFALGGDDVAAVGLDLERDGPAALVVGPRGSGRSTCLLAAARAASAHGTTVLVVAPVPDGPLAAADLPGVLGVFDGRDGELVAGALEASDGPIVILVDDADRLDPAVSDILRTFVQVRGRGQAGALVATDPEGADGVRGGLVPLARRAGNGVVFWPTSLTARLVGLGGLPEHLLGRSQPGRGVLGRSGRPESVQVAN